MEEIRAPETAPLSETGVQCFPCNNSYITSLSFHFSGNIITLLIILRVISWAILALQGVTAGFRSRQRWLRAISAPILLLKQLLELGQSPQSPQSTETEVRRAIQPQLMSSGTWIRERLVLSPLSLIRLHERIPALRQNMKADTGSTMKYS